MKNLLIILAVTLSSYSFGQTKVEQEQKQYLILNTMTYEMIHGRYDSTNYYYTYTFYSGYKYPTLQEGFYTVGLFLTKTTLLLLYTELSNLETLEDGLYKLSCQDGQNLHYSAYKSGSKIKITSETGYTKYAKFSMEDIKADLIIIQKMNSNN